MLLFYCDVRTLRSSAWTFSAMNGSPSANRSNHPVGKLSTAVARTSKHWLRELNAIVASDRAAIVVIVVVVVVVVVVAVVVVIDNISTYYMEMVVGWVECVLCPAGIVLEWGQGGPHVRYGSTFSVSDIYCYYYCCSIVLVVVAVSMTVTHVCFVFNCGAGFPCYPHLIII